MYITPNVDYNVVFGTFFAFRKCSNVFAVNGIFNEIARDVRIPKHGSGQCPVYYWFFQSTDVLVFVVVNTNLFLSGFQLSGLIDVVISTIPINE